MKNGIPPIIYVPRVLRGMTEICAEMGVGREKVLDWVSQGAPIICEMSGQRPTYTCETMELLRWRLAKSRE